MSDSFDLVVIGGGPGGYAAALYGASAGLVTVLVARDRGGSTAGVCFYLVDTWCLGLKNAAGPQSMDRRRLGGFIQQVFSAWDEPAVQVPLELGRQIVYGAIILAAVAIYGRERRLRDRV